METDLALYAAGDLPFWRGALVWFHVRHCDGCRELVDALRADREELRRSADDMPVNVDWDQLAAEMKANIRVGLAAGECVTPRERKAATISWRPAAIVAGLMVVLAGAWWLNIPRSRHGSDRPRAPHHGYRRTGQCAAGRAWSGGRSIFLRSRAARKRRADWGSSRAVWSR